MCAYVSPASTVQTLVPLMEMEVLSSVPRMKTLSGPLRFPFTAMYSAPAMETGIAWSPKISWQFPGG